MKVIKTIADLEALSKGDKVHVSDGTQEPPKHHSKKHRSWSFRNYTGFLYRHGPSCGRYEITIAPHPNSTVVNCYGINDRTFSIVEEECSHD